MRIKYWVFASLMMASAFSAYAQSAPPPSGAPKAAKPANFAEHKQKALARIEKHLEVMKTLRSCVQAANDEPALRSCKKTAHDAMPHHEKDEMHEKHDKY
jgi:hypothetical protein